MDKNNRNKQDNHRQDRTIHETQQVPARREELSYVNKDLQYSGRGPSSKKVILKDLPVPIRIFAVFVMTCSVGGTLLIIIMSFLRS